MVGDPYSSGQLSRSLLEFTCSEGAALSAFQKHLVSSEVSSCGVYLDLTGLQDFKSRR